MAAEQNLSSLPSDSLVPIRTIASLTGVNPVTLRAWERRYKLLEPTRTPKGHRLYSTADIDLIKRVVSLLESGISISQVKQILTADAQPQDEADAVAETFDIWRDYQQRLMDKIIAFDEPSMNELYNEILAVYPIDIVTNRLIVPVLRELGWRWYRGGRGRVSEEHFFTVFLRNKLGARYHHRSRQAYGSKLLAACLPGEQHEVGMLLFALVVQDWDYQVILLGANTPLDELPEVVQRTSCQAVILAGACDPQPELLQRELPILIKQLDVPLCIGGRIVESCTPTLDALGVIVLPSDFTQAVHIINNTVLNHAHDNSTHDSNS